MAPPHGMADTAPTPPAEAGGYRGMCGAATRPSGDGGGQGGGGGCREPKDNKEFKDDNDN